MAKKSENPRLGELLITSLFFPLALLFLATCNGPTSAVTRPNETSNARTPPVGGGCDGCELMYVGMPASINAVDTSSGWREGSQKLVVTGTVYHLGGKNPAPNVIIYYWQTDDAGYYSPQEGMEAAARRHGNLRGWVKTDEQGKYAIYTSRPAPYPDDDMPAHIHTSIKEPELTDEYYIDEFVFADDVLLTDEKKKALENRGGSGILFVNTVQDRQVAEHDIMLGLNIPHYPASDR